MRIGTDRGTRRPIPAKPYPPHQNRGSLKTRATEIGMEFQSVLAKDAVEGISY